MWQYFMILSYCLEIITLYSNPIKMIVTDANISCPNYLALKFSVYLYRDSLNQKLNERIFEKKQQQETLIYMQGEKDKELRNLKKMELQMKMIHESLQQEKSQHKTLKLEVCMNTLIRRIPNFLAENPCMDLDDLDQSMIWTDPSRGRRIRLF